MQKIKTLLVRHWFLLTITLFLIITGLSLLPLPQLPSVPGKDKTFHFLAYAVFAFPVSFARPKHYILILIFIISWSGLMELIQPYVNRYGELKDLTANTIGVVIGFVIARLANRLM